MLAGPATDHSAHTHYYPFAIGTWDTDTYGVEIHKGKAYPRGSDTHGSFFPSFLFLLSAGFSERDISRRRIYTGEGGDTYGREKHTMAAARWNRFSMNSLLDGLAPRWPSFSMDSLLDGLASQ